MCDANLSCDDDFQVKANICPACPALRNELAESGWSSRWVNAPACIADWLLVFSPEDQLRVPGPTC